MPIAQVFFKRNRNNKVIYKINFHFYTSRHLLLFLFIGYLIDFRDCSQIDRPSQVANQAAGTMLWNDQGSYSI
jgi:hypothetical protein